MTGVQRITFALLTLATLAFSAGVSAHAVPSSQTESSEMLDKKVADAISESTGVNTDKKDLEPKKALPLAKVVEQSTGFGLNPLRVFYGPVTEMQETVVKLEQQIMRLQGPIAGIRQPMLDLREDVRKVDARLLDVNKDMRSIERNLVTTSEKIQSTNEKLEIGRAHV